MTREHLQMAYGLMNQYEYLQCEDPI